jgi:hypothetical protein
MERDRSEKKKKKKKKNNNNNNNNPCDGESNISTVAMRVVGGDKKGSLKSETVKYGRESHGT